MTAPRDIPYRAFHISDFAGASFSNASQEQISNNREILVKSIRARLSAIDLAKPAKEIPKDPSPEEDMDGDLSGCDPATLNPLLLNLIRNLHAIETLSELLTLEEKLVKGIAKAKDDAEAVPPVVSGWFVGSEGPYNENEEPAKRDRRVNLFQSRIAQRDLVMLIAILMREKKYEPYLKSTLEAKYAKGLKALGKKDGLDKIKPGEPRPKELEHWEISMDPVTNLPVEKYSVVLIPYSRETRDEVRAAATQWISEHP